MQQSRPGLSRNIVWTALSSGVLAVACGFEPEFGAPSGAPSAGIAGYTQAGASGSAGGAKSSPGGVGGVKSAATGGSLGVPAGTANEAGEGGRTEAEAGMGSESGGASAVAGAPGEGGEPGIGGEPGVGGASSGQGGRAGATGGGAGKAGVGGASGTAGRGGDSAGSGGLGGRGGQDASGGRGGADEPAAGRGGTDPGPVRALIISEYLESSRHKALEIRALRAGTLDGCRVAIHSNGGTSARSIVISGELAADDTYLLCSSSLAEELGSVCDRSLSVTFNGNDAVVLECDGTPVDSIGQVGFDPGEAWEAGGVSTQNQLLRRACQVERGDVDPTDPFDPSLGWRALPAETLTGLGSPFCE